MKKEPVENDKRADPKISVIIPVWNNQNSIGAAIDSLLVQSLKNHEIIVVNDGSTDGTAAVCKEYAQRGQILLLEQENQGCSVARNTGLKRAKGEYVAFLDADDAALPESLEKRAAVLDSLPEVQAVFSNFLTVDSRRPDPFLWMEAEDLRLLKQTAAASFGNVSVLGAGYLKAATARPRLFPWVGTLMARRAVFSTVGNFDPSLPSAEDMDLWFRMAMRCAFAYLDEPLAIYYWALWKSEKKMLRRLVCRLRIFRKFKALCPKDMAHSINVIIGKAHFDLGLLLAQNRRMPQAIGHLARSLCYPYVYQRLFRSVPPLALQGDAGPILHDVQRLRHFARRVFRLKKAPSSLP